MPERSPKYEVPLASRVASTSGGVRARSRVPGLCWGEPPPRDLPCAGSPGNRVKVSV